MTKGSDTGLRGALQLDQAADDLVRSRASAAEKDDGAALDTLPLFQAESVFGRLIEPGHGLTKRSGPGRPRGSLSRRTKDLAAYAAKIGGNPIMAMIEIVATPIDVIAATLGCKKIEAAEYHRKVMSDLGPYLEQRLPQAVQVQGPNAGMLVINLGGPVGEGGSNVGLNIKLINQNTEDATRIIEHEQNQALSEDDSAAPHNNASHE